MITLDDIRQLLAESRGEEAIAAVDAVIAASPSRQTLATAYYLRGNAYCQRGDWRNAMNNYLESIDLDPDGPAAEAYRAAQQVLSFYNHDLYNP